MKFERHVGSMRKQIVRSVMRIILYMSLLTVLLWGLLKDTRATIPAGAPREKHSSDTDPKNICWKALLNSNILRQ